MTRLPLGEALRAAKVAEPGAIGDVVLQAAAVVGATDAVVYLVDFAQQTLEPLPDRRVHADLPASQPVGRSMAGRAFVEQVAVVAERDEEVQVWVPVLEGSDRTGVLSLTLPAADPEVVRACEELGLLVGYLIATHARSTDLYNLRRRRRSLTLAASMQWDLLPPLVLKTERVTVAGLLEPAYEVGGDCFDYALNGSVLDVGVFDPMGHGIRSALMASLCVGGYRHDRRENRSLELMHAHLDAAMAREMPGSFTTGQLVRLDLQRGAMTWTNAGHPLPLHIRGGSVLGELESEPTVPWGVGGLADEVGVVTMTRTQLEPGDGVLFYTDGVIEARLPGGDPFGLDRLVDLVTRHASEDAEPEEVVRHLVDALLERHRDLGDDATVVLLEWHGSRTG